MRSLRFVIAAPAYDGRFGGVMVLHQLCDALNRLGHAATIALFGGTGPHFNWAYSNETAFYHPALQRTPLEGADANAALQEFLRDGFVVYPDLIGDNPLGAQRVIRYLLYTNHGYRAQSPQEFVLSFSRAFHDSPDAYLFKTMLDPEFHTRDAAPWEHRSLDICYLGKGPNFRECHRIPDTLLLTRDWPPDKNQLGQMLRACRYFFSWDSVSQTNVDAIACGAVPVLLNDVQIDKDFLDRGETGALPALSLANTMDKSSLVGDLPLAQMQLAKMRTRIEVLEREWPQRVEAFVDSLRQFYQLTD